MTDRDVLAEARELLDGIAGLRPPWELDTENYQPGLGYPIWADDGDLIVYAGPPGGHPFGDAGEFIAAAPDLVARLVGEVERLRALDGTPRRCTMDGEEWHDAPTCRDCRALDGCERDE